MSKPRSTEPTGKSPPKGVTETPAKGPKGSDAGKPASKGAVETPEKAGQGAAAAKEKPTHPRPDPTRFGDWEKNGRCIDF